MRKTNPISDPPETEPVAELAYAAGTPAGVVGNVAAFLVAKSAGVRYIHLVG